MKQIFKNKLTIIIGIVIASIFLSACLWLALGNIDVDKGNENPTKNKQETNVNTDDELDNSKENQEETTDSGKKNESGLQVIETPDGTIDSADGSGTWTGESSTHKNDNSEATSAEQENILVDDKVWGDVN